MEGNGFSHDLGVLILIGFFAIAVVLIFLSIAGWWAGRKGRR